MHINRLELKTSDLKEQALFYGETLGLDARIIAGRQLVIQAGNTELVFRQADEGENCLYHFAFNIPENQFENAIQWLSMRAELLANQDGETILKSKTWNSESLYFKDTAGNILELIARHELDNASDEFKILSISEIGLCTPDVLEFVQTLKEKTGLTPYKDESSYTFTAVGDANGLFIVVKQGRIWYPNTGVPAELLPVKVEFQVDEKNFTLHGFPYEIN